VLGILIAPFIRGRAALELQDLEAARHGRWDLPAQTLRPRVSIQEAFAKEGDEIPELLGGQPQIAERGDARVEMLEDRPEWALPTVKSASTPAAVAS
jgi:hypothetical protein